MADFGFVIFNDIEAKQNKNTGKIKSLALKIFRWFVGNLLNAGFFKTQIGTRLYYNNKKDEFAKNIYSHVLLETVRSWIIKLPFSAAVYSRLNKKFLYEFLKNMCKEKGIENCLVPLAIREDAVRYGFELFPFREDKLLLKSLLAPALQEIYKEAGKRLDQLDMVVVSGSDDEELVSIVRQMEPYISFITVISENREEVENTFTELFADSGLAFVISSEYKNHLKSADLVLNLGNPLNISKYRMSRKALLLNLNAAKEAALQGETLVINDISVEIPGQEVKNLMYELHGYYSRAEVQDMIVAGRLESGRYSKYTPEAAGIIMKDFRKAGLKIGGYVGRRGVIGKDVIVKTVM